MTKIIFNISFHKLVSPREALTWCYVYALCSFECVLCPTVFKSLDALVWHLVSVFVTTWCLVGKQFILFLKT